jgi:hypothetical protein
MTGSSEEFGLEQEAGGNCIALILMLLYFDFFGISWALF